MKKCEILFKCLRYSLIFLITATFLVGGLIVIKDMPVSCKRIYIILSIIAFEKCRVNISAGMTRFCIGALPALHLLLGVKMELVEAAFLAIFMGYFLMLLLILLKQVFTSTPDCPHYNPFAKTLLWQLVEKLVKKIKGG